MISCILTSGLYIHMDYCKPAKVGVLISSTLTYFDSSSRHILKLFTWPWPWPRSWLFTLEMPLSINFKINPVNFLVPLSNMWLLGLSATELQIHLFHWIANMFIYKCGIFVSQRASDPLDYGDDITCIRDVHCPTPWFVMREVTVTILFIPEAGV